MASEIKNRVADSKLITLDLEDFYPSGKRLEIDISQFLFKGIILKEKEFRLKIKAYNWKQYQHCYIALTNKKKALVPAWAFMLITTELNTIAKLIIVGNKIELENLIFSNIINKIDVSNYKNKSVIIKGCSKKNIPENCYIQLIQKIQPVVKSIMYGEACSSVPLFKKKISLLKNNN